MSIPDATPDPSPDRAAEAAPAPSPEPPKPKPKPKPQTVADIYNRAIDESLRRPRAPGTVYHDELSRAVVAHGCPVVLRFDDEDCLILTSDGGPVTRQPARFGTAEAPGKERT